MTRQLMKFGAAVMTTLLALVVIWQFRIVVVYLLISLTLAATVRPLIKRLPSQRFLGKLAWIIVYLVVLIGIGTLIFITIEAAISEIQRLAQTVSSQDTWTMPKWLEGTTFQQFVVAQLPPPSKLFEAITGDQGQLVLPALLGVTQSFLDILGSTLVVLFLSIYWIVDQVHFERLWLSLLPSGQRKQARDIWRTIEPDLGAYIRSQLLHSLLVGLLLWLGYWALGSPYPAFLALTGAVACLIPVVGPILAVIPPLFVGLMTGIQLSVLTVLYVVVVLIALGVWIKPRLFNRQWDNPILTLVILIILGSTFGLVGIVIAPPFSAACQILWNLLVSHRLASGAASQVSDLKERQERVWETIKAMDGLPIPLLTSSMERLNQLIVKAEPILEAALPAETPDPFTNIMPNPIVEETKSRTPMT